MSQPKLTYLKDTSAFPDMGGVDVYKWQTEFDYTRWTPDTKVQLCNVPWTNYAPFNAVKFETNAARDAYFSRLKTLKVDLTFNTRINEVGVVRLPLPFDEVARYNYITVDYGIATSDGKKLSYETGKGITRYFYFIDDFSGVKCSPNMTEVSVSVDWWTTCINDVTINYMMLERGHAPITTTSVEQYLAAPQLNSTYLLAPDVNYGDARYTTASSDLVINSTVYVCIATTADPTLNWGSTDAPVTPAASSYTLQDTPSCYVFGTNAETLTDLLAAIDDKAPQFKQTIQGVFFVPTELVGELQGFMFCGVACALFKDAGQQNMPLLTLTQDMFNYDDDYKGLAKLYTSPYAHIIVTDGSGKELTIKIEDTISGTLTLDVALSFAWPAIGINGWLRGVGADNLREIEFRNINARQIYVSGNWYETLINWDVPVYQVVQSAKKHNDYATFYDRKQAKLAYETAQTNTNASADNTYNNAVRSNNTALNNAGTNALTAQTNAYNSADNALTNTNASADTAYDNAKRSADAIKDTASASNTTSYNNAKCSADTTLSNANASAATAYDNAKRGADAGLSNANASANTAYTNAERSAATSSDNTKRSAQASYNNSNASINQAATNATRSADTARDNAHASADTGYNNAVASADAAQANTNAGASTAQDNTKASAATAQANTKNSNVATSNNADLQRAANLAVVTASNKASTDNTASSNGLMQAVQAWDADTSRKLINEDADLTTTTATINGISGTIQAGVSGAATSGVGGAIVGAIGGAINGVLGYVNAQNAVNTSKTKTEYTIENSQHKINETAPYNTTVTGNTTNAALENIVTSNTLIQSTTANNVNASNVNADNTYNAAAANALRSYDTTVANASRSADTAKSNATASRDTAKDNATRTHDTTITNVGETQTTDNLNAENSFNTAITNADASYDTAVINAAATRDTTKSTATTSYNAAIASAAATRDTAKSNAKANYDTTIANAGTTRDTTASNINTNYDAAIANATATRNTAKSNATNTYNTAISNADSTYNAAVKTATATNTTANTSAKNTLDTTKANATRTANTAQSAIDNTYAQHAVDAPYIYGASTATSEAINKPMMLSANVVTQPKSAIAQAAAEFSRYGYKLHQQWYCSDFNLMRYFTYWQCSEVWLTSSNTLINSARRYITQMLQSGVTVWRNPDDIGAVSIYANNS